MAVASHLNNSIPALRRETLGIPCVDITSESFRSPSVCFKMTTRAAPLPLQVQSMWFSRESKLNENKLPLISPSVHCEAVSPSHLDGAQNINQEYSQPSLCRLKRERRGPRAGTKITPLICKGCPKSKGLVIANIKV